MEIPSANRTIKLSKMLFVLSCKIIKLREHPKAFDTAVR